MSPLPLEPQPTIDQNAIRERAIAAFTAERRLYRFEEITKELIDRLQDLERRFPQ